jgi:hypothetical protein
MILATLIPQPLIHLLHLQRLKHLMLQLRHLTFRLLLALMLLPQQLLHLALAWVPLAALVKAKVKVRVKVKAEKVKVEKAGKVETVAVTAEGETAAMVVVDLAVMAVTAAMAAVTVVAMAAAVVTVVVVETVAAVVVMGVAAVKSAAASFIRVITINTAETQKPQK